MTNNSRQQHNAASQIRSARGRRVGKIEKAKDARGALRRLVIYLRPHYLALVVVFFLMLIFTVFSLLGPYFLGVAIDDFMFLGEATGLLRTALLMLGAYLIAWLTQMGANWIMARVSQRALRKLRKDLFEHIQTLSLSFFDSHPHGELMSRLTNDVEAINQAISQNVTQLVTNTLTLIGLFVTMLVLNIWLALATMITIPLMMWVTMMIARKTRTGYREYQKDLGKMNGTIEETISGQHVVNAFRRNQSAREEFVAKNQAVFRAGVFANSYSMLLMPLTGAMSNLNVAVLAGFGGWLALQGLVSVGTIATFISYSRRFMQPLRELANMYNTVQSALAGAERVFQIIDQKAEIQDTIGAPVLTHIKGLVQFDAVDFSYVPEIPVIKDMSLEANPGQTIALVGPTGAGKTTIVNLLTRFYDIGSGRILIDGQDIRTVDKDSLRGQLGIVLQDAFLFSGTVMENIRYGKIGASDEECVEAAKLANAHSFVRRLPLGYQTELEERGNNLSQGQRQLLTIARAILADPGILILDEATSSVDTRTEMRIQQGLLRLMDGRTSFVIAHRLSTIKGADQVLVIDDGRVIERGTHQELLDQRGFYHNLYVSQFRGAQVPTLAV
jgi:ATP-binding cassette, subfamily B, multidrug efflux pump